MRRAVTLVFGTLLAAATALAQSPANTGGSPTGAPQAQQGGAMPASGAATGEDKPGNAPAGQESGSGGANQSTSAATGTPAQSSAGVADLIAAGMEIRATLDTPLSTKTSKPGDRFTATITEPARGSNGSVVVPTGARIEGELAEADESKEPAALRDKSKLSLRFRDIVLPEGQTLPLSATLISVNDTNGRRTKKSDEESQMQSGARNKDLAKDASTGAGLVFGAPLKGLAIGAMAGGGYVLPTKGNQVNLPAQTGMVIRLDQPVSGAAAAPR